jgi:hypothetical protein
VRGRRIILPSPAAVSAGDLRRRVARRGSSRRSVRVGGGVGCHPWKHGRLMRARRVVGSCDGAARRGANCSW